MSQGIKLRRSAVPGKIPTTAQLELGEIAINTHDGKLFFKRNNGTESIQSLRAVSDTQVANWDEAYSWGDHSLEGYLTTESFTELSQDITPQLGGNLEAGDNLITFDGTVGGVTAPGVHWLDDDDEIGISVTGYATGIYNRLFLKASEIECQSNTNFKIRNPDEPGAPTCFQVASNGATTLYYDSSYKLQTASNGVNVSGTIYVTPNEYSETYNSGQWTQAYNWGNHADENYLSKNDMGNWVFDPDAGYLGNGAVASSNAQPLEVYAQLATSYIRPSSSGFGLFVGADRNTFPEERGFFTPAYSTAPVVVSNQGTGGVRISVGNSPPKNYNFTTTGITFPDGTEQTTAFTGVDETVTSLTYANNILSYTDEEGSLTQLNLSDLLDEDARAIQSGTLNATTGVVTFVRDDSSTFTLDLSGLLDDTNLVTSVNGHAGVVVLDADDLEDGSVNAIPTLTQEANWDEAYGWGNHADGGYLTSETSHADVVVDGDFTSSGLMKRGASTGSYSIVDDNSANWNEAHGWGNHADAGYLTSYSETFTSIVQDTTPQLGGDLDANGHDILIDSTDSIKWMYNSNPVLTITSDTQSTLIQSDVDYLNIRCGANGILRIQNANLNGVTEFDPTGPAKIGYADDVKITTSSEGATVAGTLTVDTGSATYSSNQWNQAYTWGDHSLYGYLTSVDWQTDITNIPNSISGYGITDAYTISQIDTLLTNRLNWDDAYSWGDHASAGYLTSETTTSLALVGDTLTFTDETGAATEIDLSAYMDEDARAIASGVLNGSTGVVTFTRDDATTFTLDLSDLLDDTNAVLSVNGQTGIVTLNADDIADSATLAIPSISDQLDWTDAYSWGDHSAEGYLKSSNIQSVSLVTSLNDGDPGNISITAGSTTSAIRYGGDVVISSGGNTADGSSGAVISLLGSRSSDGVISIQSSQLNLANAGTISTGSNTISDTKVGQWDTAYSWGDHSAEGYAVAADLDTIATSGLDVSLTGVGGTVVNNITALQFDHESGFDVTDLGSGVAKIGINSTFKYWDVAGQDQIVAEGLDTIELIAGNNITIGTDAVNKSVTFNATTVVSEDTSPTLGGELDADSNNIVGVQDLEFTDIGAMTTATATSNSDSTFDVAVFNASTYRSMKIVIQATNTTDNSYYVSELLCFHDGSSAYSSEYATMFTSSGGPDFEVVPVINNGNFIIRVSPSVTDTIEYKFMMQLTTV